MRLPIAHRIITEAALRGVTLTIDGERLMYSPIERMTVDLQQDLQSNQSEVKALLRSLGCCMAPRAHVRPFVAAVFFLLRHNRPRSLARRLRFLWRWDVQMHLAYGFTRARAEAVAAIWLRRSLITLWVRNHV